MRVIAGEFRSRRIKSLPGLDMRPTPDKMRETLFNILADRIEGATFLDAYAGTGAVGIEALSRGARMAIFIEKSKPGVQLIRENLESLGALSRARIVFGPTLRELARNPADIVFLDPPYELEPEYRTSLQILEERAKGLVIAQHSARFDPGERSGELSRYRLLKQGENALSFYRREPLAASEE